MLRLLGSVLIGCTQTSGKSPYWVRSDFWEESLLGILRLLGRFLIGCTQTSGKSSYWVRSDFWEESAMAEFSGQNNMNVTPSMGIADAFA